MSSVELQGVYRALRTLQAPEQVIFDPAEGCWKPSSVAFKAQSDGTVSVDLEEMLIADGRPLDHRYPRVSRAVGLIAHSVDRLTTAGFTVRHVPIEGNPYHGEARGKLPGAVRRELAATCEIIVPLDGDLAQRHKDEQLAKIANTTLAARHEN